MESISLLKYWRGGGSSTPFSTIRAVTSAAASISPPSESLSEKSGDDDDDGPFFDLEFAAPHTHRTGGEGNDQSEGEKVLSIATGTSDEREFQHDQSLSISLSDDPRPHLTVFLLKSATRLRVFMLRLRKPKSQKLDPIPTSDVASPKQNLQLNKFFINFKVDEAPIVSLFTRESSSRNPIACSQSSPEERSANSKEIVQKYLKKIKPLYVRVSKRYTGKLRFLSEADGFEGEGKEAEAASPITGRKRQKRAVSSRIRVVYKHFAKSTSAPTNATMSPAAIERQRRDDTFLEQQDGIQSAIAHCKRSLATVSLSSVI